MRIDTSAGQKPTHWLVRLLRGMVIFSAVLALLLAAWAIHCLRDRHPGYAVDLRIDPRDTPEGARTLRAGFGRVDITPRTDDPRKPVWMAGFANGRAATGVHDELWATATAIDDGHARIGIVVLDAIGFFHDDVIEVRRQLKAEWKFDYAIVCSTHSHSTPDLMGLWGPTHFKSGVDPVYRERVIHAAALALGQAAESLQPARMSVHEIPTPPDGLVADAREPKVFDSDLRVMLFHSATNASILGSIVGWGNHPETPWSRNTLLTSDYPGVLREALEHGITYDGKVHVPGLGGTHVFVNGAVGGLMTTHPGTTVRDPWLGRDFKEPSHEKTRALGHRLAQRILDRVSTGSTPAVDHAPIRLRARTLELRIDNPNFLLAPLLGVLDRGHSRWRHMRTEMAALRIGDASILCVPGEIYPEIVNGGVVRAPGGDFDMEPQEVPPLRPLMPGAVKFVFGLANDEVGYIIPKSEWDEKPPYLFGSSKPVYGEINSVGPDTAGVIHAMARQLLQELSGGGAPAGAAR